MSEELELFKEWVQTLREDVDTLKAVVEAGKADADARRFAAAGLNYFLTRMDLVPDWEDSIGVLDDVLVIRALSLEIMNHDLDEAVSTDTTVALGRLCNEAERGKEWLGNELWAKFAKHSQRLIEKTVRGRSPDVLISDDSARKAAFAELDDHLLKLPAATFKEGAGTKFKSYLEHKLK